MHETVRGVLIQPERVVKLQHLVESHPDDPTYRFLLARLYANGHFVEEAFAEYKEIALEKGFRHVASGPLVRSSYHADEFRVPLPA